MEPLEKPRTWIGRWWTWPAAACIAATVWLLPKLLRGLTSDSREASVKTATVVREDFAPALRLNGTTQAERSYVAATPYLRGAQIGSLVITKLIPSGARVKRDDVLVEFDPQAQQKDFLDKQNTYVSLSGQLAQKRAEEEVARAKDNTALKQAENDLSRAKLDVQRNEIVSRIDAEKNNLALEEAQATLKQLRETYEHKRSSAAASIRILELQRERAQNAMRNAQANAARMTLRSPMEGVAVYNPMWIGDRMRTAQLGDSVRPGLPLLQVVDPSKMEVRVDVNQVDFSRIQVGQSAQIRLDAYPGLVFPAVLKELSPLANGGQFTETVRSFSARFQVQGEDPRLLPDLSASIDFDLGPKQKALVIPRDAVVMESGMSYVYKRTATGFEKQSIRIATWGDSEVAVSSGLVPSDVIERQVSGAPGQNVQ